MLSRLKRFLKPTPPEPVLTVKPTKNIEMKKYGNDYAFCFLPLNFLNKDSVFYSVGAGEDIWVEVELAKQVGVNAHIFDPTPKSIKHFEDLVENTKKGLPMAIDRSERNYEIKEEHLQHLTFHPYGVWKEDTNVEFFLPQNEDWVSCSITNIQNTEKSISVPVKKVSTIMKELGHSHIDYLKLDIEGAEYQVIDELITANLDIKLMYIEMHANFETRGSDNYDLYEEYVQKIIDIGYDLVHIHKDCYFTFLKK